MKSRISFFEKTTFKKDLTRFAPLWAIYMIVGILIMMSMLPDQEPGWAARDLGDTIGYFSIINMIYAGVVAQLLFGDLYNSRMCNAVHSMPLQRSQLFGSHVAAGLCYSLVPHFLGALLMMTCLGEFWFVAFIWLLGMTLEYLFFFGLAVFSSFCTGNRFAMVAVYGILNFFSLIVGWFLNAVYVPMMRGVILESDIFLTLCPVVSLCIREDWIVMKSSWVNYMMMRHYTYEGMGDGWGYLGIIAAIGVALVAVSWLMYRRRQLESAGDFIAVKPLGPVFSVVFSLCVGAVFALFGVLATEGYVLFLIIGLALGWIVSQMLLQRTVRVFSLKTFGKMAVLEAVMIASLLLVRADPLGVVGWLPEPEKVDRVTISTTSSFSQYNESTVTVSDPEDIASLVEVHGEILDQSDSRYDFSFAIRYEMENGRTVVRYYNTVRLTEQLRQNLEEIYSTPQAVMRVDSWDEVEEKAEFVTVEGQVYPVKMMTGLLEAMEKDLENGNLNQVWFLHQGKSEQYYVEIRAEGGYTDYSEGFYGFWYLSIYPEAENTVAWLDAFLKELPGKSDLA